MAQRRRGDHPGSWQHVMNRGIARRTVFEMREDPCGSARAFEACAEPPWLSRWWVHALLGEPRASGRYTTLVRPPSSAVEGLVENRLCLPALEQDPLDDLVGAAPPAVAFWVLRKAALADRMKPGIQRCDPETVLA